MPDTANLCDKELLQPGKPCIIIVDEVNNPTGIWWGEIISVEPRNTWLEVTARVKGGRFALDERRKPIYSDEHQGLEPSKNYRVVPDTKTIREMLAQMAHARGSRVRMERREALAHNAP